jgi:ADP-ribosylglycohydrolase
MVQTILVDSLVQEERINQLHDTNIRRSSFLSKLGEVSWDNGYFIYEASVENPGVVLIGDYHPRNISWCADNIENILLNSVKPKESIFMEGGFGEVIYPFFNMNDAPIRFITKQLEQRGVRSFLNDSTELLEKLKRLYDLRDNALKAGDKTNLNKIVEEIEKLNENRDEFFVNGPFGLKNFSNRRYQVIGSRHILKGKIVPLLKENGISYASLFPRNIPTEAEVTAFEENLSGLESQMPNERVNAINELSKVPIRASLRGIERRLEDNSGRVRKYAALRLGKSNNQRVIDSLLLHTKDKDDLTKWTIFRALSKFQDPRIQDFAEKYFHSSDREKWTYGALLTSLKNLPKNPASIIPGLSSSDEFIRSLAIGLLGRYSRIEQTNIYPMLKDSSPAVREEAVRLLSFSHPELIRDYNTSGERDSAIVNFVERTSGFKMKKQFITEDKDKIRGSLFGTLIGDALGAPIENMNIQEIVSRYGKVRDYIENELRKKHIPKGAYTDDGELTLEIMDAISDFGFPNPYDVSKRFALIGRRVDEDPKENRGYGIGSLMSFRRLDAGVNWRFTGNPSPGCGAAMRVSPIASLKLDLEAIVEQISRITHTDPIAIAGAIAMAYAIQKAYGLDSDFDKMGFINEVAQETRNYSPILSDEISLIKNYLEVSPEEVIPKLPFSDSEPKRKGRKTIGTVPIAIYSFLRPPKDFEETIVTAINHSGDSDSIGAMAGAISGAFNGYAQIPKRYITGLHDLDKLNYRINRFLN